jgi:phosphatidylserine/phosphatidylglycerophosphate/cardiolipin synthase-like enzyme
LGYIKAIRQARKLIYLEDQYLWSTDVAAFFADALRRNPELRFVAVLPLHPDQDGRMSMPPNLIGRSNALSLIRSAAPDRVAIYGLESPAGVPVYVHAKVCVIDDTWACVGSDNLNRRSWTHDSEIGAAVLDESPDPHAYARNLRLELAREHLDRAAADDADLHEGQAFFDAYAASADALRGWHTSGGQGPRPPGRLLSLNDPPLSAATRLWAAPLYRLIYDPDGRTRRDRRQHRF